MKYLFTLLPALAAAFGLGFFRDPAPKFAQPVSSRVRREPFVTPEVFKQGLLDMWEHGVRNFFLGNLTLDNGMVVSNDACGMWKDLGDPERESLLAKMPGASFYAEARVRLEIASPQPISMADLICGGATNAGFGAIEFEFVDIHLSLGVLDDWGVLLTRCHEEHGLTIVLNGIDRLYNYVDSIGGQYDLAIITTYLQPASYPKNYIMQRYQDDRPVAWRNTTYEEIFGNDEEGLGYLMNKWDKFAPDTFILSYPLTPFDSYDLENYIEVETLHDYGCRARHDLNWTGGFMLTAHQFGTPHQHGRTNLTKYDVLAAPCDDY